MERQVMQCPYCKKNTFFISPGNIQTNESEKQTPDFNELEKILKSIIKDDIQYFNEGETIWVIIKIGKITYLQKLPTGSLKISGNTTQVLIGRSTFSAVKIKGKKPTQEYILKNSHITASTGWDIESLYKHLSLVKGDVLCYFYNESIDFSSNQKYQEVPNSFICTRKDIRTAVKYFMKLFGGQLRPEFMIGKSKSFFCVKDKNNNTFALMKGVDDDKNNKKN